MVVFTKRIREQCRITTVVIRSEDSNVRLDRLEFCVPMRVQDSPSNVPKARLRTGAEKTSKGKEKIKAAGL